MNGEPYLIPRSRCENCGAQIAWRSGVGRVVITHANGNDKCIPWSPVAKLRAEDRAAAQEIAEMSASDLVAAGRVAAADLPVPEETQ